MAFRVVLPSMDMKDAVANPCQRGQDGFGHNRHQNDGDHASEAGVMRSHEALPRNIFSEPHLLVKGEA